MAECADSHNIIDLMNCPICLERYTKPKYLPCLHTFCEDCILTYVTSILEKLDGKEHINCPVCRTTVQLPNKECTPKEFVDEIPANFLIIGLLEKEKITRLEKPCMSCERLDITSNASVICIDCSDTLCDTCQKYHKANKATYDHHIIPVSQLPDDNILPKAFKNICTKHSKKFKLFCSTHSVPCCLLCLTNDHRTCAGNNIIPVDEAAKIYCSSVKFGCLQIDLNNVSEDIDTLSHHFSQCFKDIETQYKCKLKSIENTCSSLIAKVKYLEITRKTQLAKIFDERKDTVETQMIACENHRKSIDNQKQVIDTSIGKATNVQVMIEAEKIISRVEHHKRFLADSSSKHNFKYTITVDDGNDLAKSVEQFVDSMCSLSCDCVKVPLNLVTNLNADIKPATVIEDPEDFRNVVTQLKTSRTEEEDDDEEYTTDEDEEEILFDKRIKLFSKEEDWKRIGLGTIKVIYDEDVNGNRIMVELDNKNVVCNHLVTKELNMSIDKKDCYWSPIDFSTDEPARRHFRSQFISEYAAQEFQKVFENGRQLAQESEISERDIAAFPHEITFPHGHGGSNE